MKTVLITGMSRGIGKALAQTFLQHGDFVIGSSRNGAIDFEHPQVITLPLELSDQNSRAAFVRHVVDLDKKIDILINNAGIFHQDDERAELNLATLRATLEVNLFGTIDLTEQLIPLVRDGGHIINISSRRGSLERTQDDLYPCYSISKTALNMFTRKLAARLQNKVIVSAVHPGSVETDLNKGGGKISAPEAANDLYQFACSEVETGQFWFKGERLPW